MVIFFCHVRFQGWYQTVAYSPRLISLTWDEMILQRLHQSVEGDSLKAFARAAGTRYALYLPSLSLGGAAPTKGNQLTGDFLVQKNSAGGWLAEFWEIVEIHVTTSILKKQLYSCVLQIFALDFKVYFVQVSIFFPAQMV